MKKINKCLITILIILIVIVLLFILKMTNTNNSTKIYKLGTLSEYGYMGIDLSYDKEPVDITLISPTGKKFDESNCDVYTVDKNNKRITALIDTKEIGQWDVMFDKKFNRAIRYSPVTEASPTLYLTDVKFTEINKKQYISFIPIMSDKNNTDCKYSITMSNNKKSFDMGSGKAKLNEPSYIEISPNKNAYDETNYTVQITVQTIDSKQYANANIDIILHQTVSGNNQTTN